MEWLRASILSSNFCSPTVSSVTLAMVFNLSDRICRMGRVMPPQGSGGGSKEMIHANSAWNTVSTAFALLFSIYIELLKLFHF